MPTHTARARRTVTPATPAAAALRDPRWAAVELRDPSADGRFFYAVKTTGVYCRPSCAARTPRPANVEFYSDPESAERAGYRACKRCTPRELAPAKRRAARVAELCRFIRESEHLPSLAELSRRAGWSVYYLHRVFKEATGLTPRAYASAERARRLRSRLLRSGTVTQAIHDAGFRSSSRFYEGSARMLGMAPAHFRAGGSSVAIRFAIAECSLGAILVATSGRGVCAISLGDDPDRLAREVQDAFPNAELIAGDPEFDHLVASVVQFVEAPRTGLDLPLDVRGTAFQLRVWQALQRIPPGKTASYSEVAELLGAPKAVRAVANACAKNQLAVAIPCHRVVRTDGALSGYRWGVERKRSLLARESKPR